MRCLLCNEPMNIDHDWHTFLFFKKEEPCCENCQNQLKRITGEQCKICSRPLANLDSTYMEGDLCLDCIRWEQDPEYKEVLHKNISLYEYNDFMKEVIARFKYRGDYVLARCFSEQIRKSLNSHTYDKIIPIPLSEKRLLERGFNQATALATEASLTITNALSRKHSEKQSKKSRTERIHLPQVFQLIPDQHVTNQTILLIDDIYTTGSTIRHAAKILKTAGASNIHSFTLARG
ncbi:competence protein ComFC [Oikeobacillus pervagus]|uniref:Competence protein ComFC n=1 Tax=Oikeobacillus pervagus TaxID=1325931 RepID=A0AAJ1SY71_9BACI|nr:ComF family protein [Oikeobacillus pervagus]MDQ0214960.1 competence protein ComFC [Oikeobacillus pervagus]